MYDLDIAHQIIARMQGIKSRELDNAQSQQEREKIQEELDVLHAEKNALYKNDDFRVSVIDKALHYYGSILKARKTSIEYAAVGS